jgi:hypothetical protein
MFGKAITQLALDPWDETTLYAVDQVHTPAQPYTLPSPILPILPSPILPHPTH